MRKARREVIDPAEVNVVHVCSRTVRRCFLLGDDPLTGHNYDHRKAWVKDLIERFAGQFAIDVLAFAVLSSHFHLVLRNRPDVVATWSDTEVAQRWLMICPHRKDNHGQPAPPSEPELDTIRNCPDKLREIRSRLADVSWWMRLLCQRIATRANKEDQASGRFFEQRYRATRLLDEASVVACAAYVDLNPIRAAMAETIESSDHTSVQARIASERERNRPSGLEVEPTGPRSDSFLSPVPLGEAGTPPGEKPSASAARCSDKGFLPMTTLDYFELLDWTARQSRKETAGRTPADVPPVLERVGLSAGSWTELVSGFGQLFYDVAGRPEAIENLRSHRTGRRFRVRPRLRALLPAGIA